MSIYAAAFRAVDILEAAGIRYFVAGSLSSMYYSFARATTDADFVVHFEKTSVFETLKQFGPGYVVDPQMSFETMTMSSRFVVSILDTPFKLEFFRLTDDPFDRSRFERRIRVTLQGHSLCLPTAEDVIVMKLRWSRAKDREDVKHVIAVQGANNLDWDYLNHWCNLHRSLDVLNEIVRSIPSDGN